LGPEEIGAFRAAWEEVHAAGYDLTTEKGGEETLSELDTILGLENLRWMRSVPNVVETPKGKDGVAMDRRNLALLRRLAEAPASDQGSVSRREHPPGVQ
jgi:hypothetical protein